MASSYGAINVYGTASGGYYNVNGGGNVYVGGTNGAKFNMNDGGTVSSGVPGGGTFQSSFGNTLVSLSNQLANLSATSTFPSVTQNTNNNVAINAVANASGIAVFDVSGAQLQQMASFNVNLDGASTVVFDVTGNYAQNANFENMNDSSVDSHVIWNFENATSVSLQGFGGTVLAENATVTNSSALNGDLVAANFNGSGELHDHAFAGVLPAADPAPLPPAGSTVAGLLAMTGLAIPGVGWRIRLRRDAFGRLLRRRDAAAA
jgi:choice-of-anchor A domain-containing protein